MMEKAFYFGEQNHLLGLVSLPDESQFDASRPAVILLTPGLFHRISPFRFNVDFARKIRHSGFLSMRLDLSGIGDSLPSPSNNQDAYTRSVEDVQTAMSELTNRYGCKRFVLLGNCLAADHAYRTTLVDDRVVGTMLLDGYSYGSFKSQFRYYLSRITSKAFWQQKFQRIRSESMVSQSDESLPVDASINMRVYPPVKQFLADLRQMLSAEKKLCLVYSHQEMRQASGHYVYPGQIKEMVWPVKHADGLEEYLFAHADHIYTRIEDRQALMAVLHKWLVRHF